MTFVMAGASVAPAGDVNGDGFGDVVAIGLAADGLKEYLEP